MDNTSIREQMSNLRKALVVGSGEIPDEAARRFQIYQIAEYYKMAPWQVEAEAGDWVDWLGELSYLHGLLKAYRKNASTDPDTDRPTTSAYL